MRHLRNTLGIFVAAALMAAAVSLAWLPFDPRPSALPVSVAPHSSTVQVLQAVVLMLLAVTAYYLLSGMRARITVLAALVVAVALPIILNGAVRALTHGSSLCVALLAIPLLTLSYRSRQSRVAAALILAVPLAATSPFTLAPPRPILAAALAYQPLPILQSSPVLLIQCLLAGLVAAIATAYLLNRPLRRAMSDGMLWGATVATSLLLSHTLAALVLMRTAGSPATLLLALALFWTALALAAWLSLRAHVVPQASLLLRSAPVPVTLIAVASAVVLGFGTHDYSLIDRFRPDRQYTYVHFRSDGTWSRTVESSGSTTRLWRCERFLATYPRSAYRPAALLKLAECQYELWDFHAAAETLNLLRRETPRMRGYPDLLTACALSASGDSRSMLRLSRADPMLAQWARADGALLHGANAERLGMPHRALGFYNAHIEFLRTRQPTSWTDEAARFASRQADAALERASMGRARTGNVRLRLIACGAPVRNARVVLVRPHPDAALPSDSRLFTGAWTVPAWNGIWGKTDHTGSVSLSNVPYGDYDLVIGLALHTARQGYVVSSWVPPVHVAAPETTFPTVTLVRSIQLRTPRPGDQVSPTPRLTWTPVPGAAQYSVSIVTAAEPRSGPARPMGQTCWARSGIKSTSVVVEPGYYTDPHFRLKKGGYYMWIVYAVDKDGRLLTSSEHYAQTHEPTFQLR